MKKGLVLEGGALRGLFTSAVLDVFLENGIEFDGAVGVSAGAAFGCNYRSKQIGRVLRYNARFCGDPRYVSLQSLISTGDIFGAEFCYHTIPDELDIFDRKTFSENECEFYVVASDAETGEAVYHRCVDAGESDLEWIRASASMPLLSRVVDIGGQKLLDGGICDSIPIRFFEDLGYDRNVVVLTRPEGYVKTVNRYLPVARVILRKYPKFLDAMERRHEMYNETLEYIAKREKAGEIVVIRPPCPLAINSIKHDKADIYRVYNIGRISAIEAIGKVREFLNG